MKLRDVDKTVILGEVKNTTLQIAMCLAAEDQRYTACQMYGELRFKLCFDPDTQSAALSLSSLDSTCSPVGSGLRVQQLASYERLVQKAERPTGWKRQGPENQDQDCCSHISGFLKRRLPKIIHTMRIFLNLGPGALLKLQ